MKTAEVDIPQCFKPILGTQPWKVKVGVGSFLTFEFGARVKTNGHIHGQWHLWIYLSNWTLFHGDRQLADSDADRRVMMAAVRRLEGTALTEVEFDAGSLRTRFVFGNFCLIVSAADYVDRPDERDEFWMFFMPNNEVLTVGPAGVKLDQACSSSYA